MTRIELSTKTIIKVKETIQEIKQAESKVIDLIELNQIIDPCCFENNKELLEPIHVNINHIVTMRR